MTRARLGDGLPTTRISVPLVLLFMLCACAPMVSYKDMGAALDQSVGLPIPKGPYPLEWSFRKGTVGAESYELFSIRPDDCNYVLTVRNIDDVVLSWRYLEAIHAKPCRFQHVRQLM